jgi:hypothetical protein
MRKMITIVLLLASCVAQASDGKPPPGLKDRPGLISEGMSADGKTSIYVKLHSMLKTDDSASFLVVMYEKERPTYTVYRTTKAFCSQGYGSIFLERAGGAKISTVDVIFGAGGRSVADALFTELCLAAEWGDPKSL